MLYFELSNFFFLCLITILYFTALEHMQNLPNKKPGENRVLLF